jgi:hypothetical protein
VFQLPVAPGLYYQQSRVTRSLPAKGRHVGRSFFAVCTLSVMRGVEGVSVSVTINTRASWTRHSRSEQAQLKLSEKGLLVPPAPLNSDRSTLNTLRKHLRIAPRRAKSRTPLSWTKQTAILVSQTVERQEARVQGTSGAVRQSAEDLQRCDNGCSVSY